MALKRQTLSHAFAKGMDQKSSDKTRPVGSLTEVKNGVFEKGGQIRKRRGFTIKGNSVPLDSGTITRGEQITSFKDEIIVFDGESAYGRASTGDWVNRGDVRGMTVKNSFVRRDPRSKHSNAQVAIANNIAVYAWVDYTASASTTDYVGYVEIRDALTDALLVDRRTIFTFSKAFTATGTCSSVSTATVNGSSTKFLSEFAPGNSITIGGTTRIVDAVASDTVLTATVSWSGGESGAITGSYAVGENTLQFHPHLQVAALNGYIFILYADSTVTGETYVDIEYRVIDTTSGVAAGLTMTSAANLVKCPRLYPGFSMDVTKNETVTSGALVLFYENASNSDKATVHYFTHSGTTLSSGASNTAIYDTVSRALEFQKFDITTSATNVVVSATAMTVKGLHTLASDGTPSSSAANQVAVIYRCQNTAKSGSNRELRILILDDALTAVDRNEAIETLGANKDVLSVGVTHSTTQIVAFIERCDNTGGQLATGIMTPFSLYHLTLARTGSASKSYTKYYENVSVLSDGWTYGEKHYFLVCAITNLTYLSSCIAVVDSKSGRVQAKWNLSEPATCFPLEWRERAGTTFKPRMSYGASRIIKTADTTFECGLSQYDPSQVLYDGQVITWTNITRMSLDMSPTRYLKSVEVSGGLLTAGGLLWHYAGDYFKEHGFITYPTTQGTGTTSGSLTAGEYQYMVIYEWQDKTGNVQRSFPSAITKATLTSAGGINFQVYGLQLTNKKDVNGKQEAKAYVYGTDADDIAMYLKGTIDMSTDALKYDFTDDGTNLANVDPSTRPVPYVEDGQIGNVEPPSCTDIVAYNGRVAVATTADAVMISKPLVSGDQAGFTNIPGSQFAISVDNYTEEITALATNLEHLLVFTATDGYVISGEGPDAFGHGEYIGPRLFAPDQGCQKGRAATETPLGVIYNSSHGYYWVQRNMAIQYIGAMVEDFNADPALTVDVLDHRHEVRFLLGGSSTGTVLVYNYQFNQWAIFEFDTSALGPNVGAAVVNGVYYRLSTAGRLFEEETTVFKDTGASGVSTYDLSLTTNHMKFPQFHAQARFYRVGLIGAHVDDSVVSVAVFNDYESTASTTFSKTFNAANSNNAEPTQLRVRLNKQKLKALQVKFTVVATDEGMKLEGIAYEVGEKKSVFKEGTERRAT